MAQPLQFFVDDTSPTIAYVPFGDSFSTPTLGSGWNPYFDGSGFATSPGETGNGTSLHITSLNNASLSIRWRGTGIQLLGNATQASYTTTLDGTLTQPDFVDPSNQLLADFHDLDNTDHLITLTANTPLTQNPPDSSMIVFDKALIIAPPLITPSLINATFTLQPVNESNIVFLGNWSFHNESHQSNASGDRVQLGFTGTSILLSGTTSPGAANYTVTLDNSTSTYSGKSSFFSNNSLLYFATGLDGETTHMLSITNDDGGLLSMNVGGFQVYAVNGSIPSNPVPSLSPLASLNDDSYSKGTIAAFALAGILAFIIITSMLFFYLVYRPRRRRQRLARRETRRKEQEAGIVLDIGREPSILDHDSGRSGFSRWRHEMEAGFNARGLRGLGIAFRHSDQAQDKSSTKSGEMPRPSTKSSGLTSDVPWDMTLGQRGKGRKSRHNSSSSWTPSFTLDLPAFRAASRRGSSRASAHLEIVQAGHVYRDQQQSRPNSKTPSDSSYNHHPSVPRSVSNPSPRNPGGEVINIPQNDSRKTLPHREETVDSRAGDEIVLGAVRSLSPRTMEVRRPPLPVPGGPIRPRSLVRADSEESPAETSANARRKRDQPPSPLRERHDEVADEPPRRTTVLSTLPIVRASSPFRVDFDEPSGSTNRMSGFNLARLSASSKVRFERPMSGSRPNTADKGKGKAVERSETASRALRSFFRLTPPSVKRPNTGERSMITEGGATSFLDFGGGSSDNSVRTRSYVTTSSSERDRNSVQSGGTAPEKSVLSLPAYHNYIPPPPLPPPHPPWSPPSTGVSAGPSTRWEGGGTGSSGLPLATLKDSPSPQSDTAGLPLPADTAGAAFSSTPGFESSSALPLPPRSPSQQDEQGRSPSLSPSHSPQRTSSGNLHVHTIGVLSPQVGPVSPTESIPLTVSDIYFKHSDSEGDSRSRHVSAGSDIPPHPILPLTGSGEASSRHQASASVSMSGGGRGTPGSAPQTPSYIVQRVLGLPPPAMGSPVSPYGHGGGGAGSLYAQSPTPTQATMRIPQTPAHSRTGSAAVVPSSSVTGSRTNLGLARGPGADSPSGSGRR